MQDGGIMRILDALLVRGRRWTPPLGRRGATDGSGPSAPVDVLANLCRKLLTGRGEASGVLAATEFVAQYERLDPSEKAQFFERLVTDFGPNWSAARIAWTAHEANPSRDRFKALTGALEAPRQELFRRINQAPGGTAALVRLRADLLAAMGRAPALAIVDDDLSHLLQSWFNRGFLVTQRIDWSSPADILERIIGYEAVHEIKDWADLRRRLLPPDRRCYAFFHPAMANDPLIFVEIALTTDIPGSIQKLLTPEPTVQLAEDATTAVFYSISNCQPGLHGISFGNFLIKQVVEELSRELPALTTFVTLSPGPGFRRWLGRHVGGDREGGARIANALAIADRLAGETTRELAREDIAVAQGVLSSLAAEYFLNARTADGRPVDPVARFHLGNGARLQRLCWPGDTSAKGISQSAGLMVNYHYDLAWLAANHEAFANEGRIAASGEIRRLAAKQESRKDAVKHHADEPL